MTSSAPPRSLSPLKPFRRIRRAKPSISWLLSPMLSRLANLKAARAICIWSWPRACSATEGCLCKYFRQAVDQKFTDGEYRATLASGVTHTLSLAPKPETARIRLLVCDTATGMIGSVDLPYSREAAPTIQAENKTDVPESPPATAESAV